MIYYLTSINDRLVITNINTGLVKKSVKAKNWLNAKLKLGFNLTPIQKSLIK